MSLFKKYTEAWNERKISAYLELNYHDYEMTFHSTGEVQKLEASAIMIGIPARHSLFMGRKNERC